MQPERLFAGGPKCKFWSPAKLLHSSQSTVTGYRIGASDRCSLLEIMITRIVLYVLAVLILGSVHVFRRRILIVHFAKDLWDP